MPVLPVDQQVKFSTRGRDLLPEGFTRDTEFAEGNTPESRLLDDVFGAQDAAYTDDPLLVSLFTEFQSLKQQRDTAVEHASLLAGELDAVYGLTSAKDNTEEPPSEHAKVIRSLGGLARSIEIGWRDSLPEEVRSLLLRIAAVSDDALA